MSAPGLSPLPRAGETALPLPLLLKGLYGLGEIPITATMGLFGIYVLLFYNSVMGLNAGLAGFGITAGLVVDAVLDPFIGFRSDASRLSLGRRQAFMLFGCLGMGPLFYALLSPPQGLGTWALFTWLLVTSLGFRISFAIYRIPYLSLGAELASDYDERTRVIAVRSLLGLLGMAAAATLPLLVIFRRVAGAADPKLLYSGYPRMGLAFGALMTVAGLVAVFGTQTHRTFGDVHEGRAETRRFFHGMWLFLKNPNFRALWAAFILCSLSVVVNFSLMVHFLKWYAGIESDRAISAIQGSFYAGAVIGVVGWIWVAKRGDKRNLFALSVGGLVAILLLSSALVGRGHLFGFGSLRVMIALVAGNAVAGLFASALWVLPFSMMADVVDEDQLSCGLRREGVCFGIMNFGEKIASGGALLLSGLLLTNFIHLVPKQDAQPAGVAGRIGLTYGVVPALLLAAGIAIAMRFRLNRRAVAEIQLKLGR